MATTMNTAVAPIMSRNASEPNAIAEQNSPTIMTHWRGNRSAMTPPNSRKAIIGTLSAVSTYERVSASPPGRCSTPKESAMGAKAEPPIDAVLAQKRRANWRSRMSDQSACMGGLPGKRAGAP